MNEDEVAEIVHLPPLAGSDLMVMTNLRAQLMAAHIKACFDKDVRNTLPRMRVYVIIGENSWASIFPSVWALEDEDWARGGGFLHTEWIKGGNHFTQWDEPETMLRSCLNAFG
ncbi:uncharacterized protein FIBRA_08508 [Fibroporia radiculosa]|uniref:AB hydrolase-1 domain-containing protein n=1 Tax=Fibroporia radiculosa TaxID=599839 RepID=J4GHK6_9APHY|nr:uncharacterized protein FIBRA_08508 [Fibroporia radiculosa]CCM06258.1 predicted protein [Fibroporia radiculosa]